MAHAHASMPHGADAAGDTPIWKAILGMIVVLTILASALIGLCFLAARLVTGHAI
jgi:hypothetical protein